MQQTMQQPTYGNMFNAGHVVNPQNYMQQQFQQQQQQQQQQQNSMDAMVPMMADMIQQALAKAGLLSNGNQSTSTMAGPNGTVVQQAPGQQQQRNDTNNYLPHGQTQQSEVATLLFSDIHGEEEEAGNTGNNDSNSPVFTPPRSSHRGQLFVDTQARTPDSYSPPKGMDLSQASHVSDGEEGS